MVRNASDRAWREREIRPDEAREVRRIVAGALSTDIRQMTALPRLKLRPEQDFDKTEMSLRSRPVLMATIAAPVLLNYVELVRCGPHVAGCGRRV
jgi:hypothetical protein